jgi:hypothetical protein
MARGSNKWLEQIIDKLSTRFNEPRDEWYQRIRHLNAGYRGQSIALNNLDPAQRIALLEAALDLAGFQQSEDIHAKKFHDTLLKYHSYNSEALPDITKWAKLYHKSPHFAPTPENRVPLDQIVKTNKGTIRNPIHSLYRYLRGNAMLNESKDFISVLPLRLWDPQVTTALTKLSKNNHVKYDPKTGAILIPRDTIRQIDPYYEIYNKTLTELIKTINEDHSDAVLGEIINGQQPTSERGKKYRELAKAFTQDQMRRNMPRIAEDLPMEERERLFAEQQARIQNISDEDIANGLQQMRNHAYFNEIANSWPPVNSNSNRMKLASMFSEKGLRSLLNNPKRLLKVAQINELLEDKWNEITVPDRTWNYYPGHEDREVIPYDIYHVLPDDVDHAVHEPGGYWKRGDLQSLNNYDTFRRQLEDRERTIARNTEQARERIIQYIAAHPELQQIADQNAANRQQQRRLTDMRGIGYTRNAEDKEEEDLIKSMGNALIGNYRTVAKTLMDHPRLAELAKRPYKYSKGIMDAIGEAPITLDEYPGWRLAENRHELYERSYEHNICIGMPIMQYHDKALSKKSLLFFSGDHTDPESEAGEIALYIDPKTHKIIKTDIVQVHGFGNKPGSKVGTQNLKYIADTLVGKSVDDTNNIVEEEGVEYKEEHDPALPAPQQQALPAPQQAAGGGLIDPENQYHALVQEYADDHNYDGDMADYFDDEAFNWAHRQMGYLGYHLDDDGNYLVPGDPGYNDFDEDGNRVNGGGEFDEEDFDEDDEGYAEGGFVEPTGNPAYRRLLELLLEDGMTKPSAHIKSLMTRRF